MKQALELFTELTGWTTVTGGIHPDSLCAHRAFIADDLVASLVTHVPAGGLGKSMTRALALTLPARYTEVVLSLWSRRMSGSDYRYAADFPYKVSLDGSKYYLLPCYRGFMDVSFRGVSPTVTRVEIVTNHSEEDWLVLSGMYAIREEQPLDVLQAIQAGIQTQVTAMIGADYTVGTVTCRAGQRHIDFTGPWADRYAVIQITGGGHTELHQIEVHDEEGWTFMSTFDGPVTKYAYTAATISLYVPVRVGNAEQEIAIPGITLWTMGPEPVMRQSGVGTETDSLEEVGLGSQESREPMNLMFQVLIDCEGRQHEILARQSAAVRRFLGTNRLWVNGRRHGFEWTVQAQYVEPQGPVEILPKVQYTLDVEVKESREAPTVLVPVDTVTTTLEMEVS